MSFMFLSTPAFFSRFLTLILLLPLFHNFSIILLLWEGRFVFLHLFGHRSVIFQFHLSCLVTQISSFTFFFFHP